MDLPVAALSAHRSAHPPTGAPSASADQPDSPEDAAKAFEQVLVRRFVKVMTEKMFDNTLSGEDGPGWMNSQRDQQRDVLTDVLTDHIVESDTMGLRDMLLRNWNLSSDEKAAPDGSSAGPPITRASESHLSPAPSRR